MVLVVDVAEEWHEDVVDVEEEEDVNKLQQQKKKL
jgi:hypothetical protein